MRTAILFVCSFALVFLPTVVWGVEGGNQGLAGGNPIKVELTNPLGNITLTAFFLKLIQILIVFAVPIITFFIILAGFQYVTAGGNQEKIKKATHALTWAVIGGVIILGAQAILEIIKNTVAALHS